MSIAFDAERGIEMSLAIKPAKLSQINSSYTARYAMEKIGITPQLSPIFSV